MRLAVSVSRPLRANHRLPDLAGLVDGAGWVSVGLGLTDVVAAVVAAGSVLTEPAPAGVFAGRGLVEAGTSLASGLASLAREAG